MAHVFTHNHQPRIPALVASYFMEALLLPAAAVILSLALL
jgi:hypothetical protein